MNYADALIEATKGDKSKYSMTLADAIRGLDDLAEKLKSHKEILSKENVYALSAARSALKRLGSINVSTWTTCMGSSDGTPIEGTETPHAAISLQTEITEPEFERIYNEDAFDTDPRIIETTPEKAAHFLSGLGLGVDRL